MKFLSRHMDFLQSSGLLSSTQRKAMEEMNRDYVPFHRVQDQMEGRDSRLHGKPFQRLKGGTANVNDIWENIVYSLAHTTEAALRNRAKQNLYRMIDEAPHGKGAIFAVKAPTEARPTQVDSAQVVSVLKKMGVETDGDVLSPFITFFTYGHAPRDNSIDMVLRDGKPDYYRVIDPMIRDGLLSMGPRAHDFLLKALGAPANLLRRGVTSMPSFFVPNLIRDTMSGAVLSENRMIPIIDSIRGMGDRLVAAFSDKDSDYWEYLANGGGFSSTIHGETQEARDKIEGLYEKHMQSFPRWLVIDSPRKAIEAYDELISASEYGTRVGEYSAGRRRKKSRRESTFHGREISTDFSMRGTNQTLLTVTTGVPFMRARINGMYRMTRPVGGGENYGTFAGRLAMRAGLFITIPSLALMVNHWDFDEEDWDPLYKSLPNWIKDTHWVWITDEGTAVLIPKPFELGAIFGTIPEQMFAVAMTGDQRRLAQAFAFMFAEALALDPTPQLVKPFLDTELRNRKFTGGKIVPPDMEGAEAWLQYKPWTPELVKRAGRLFGVSPLKLEHWITGFTGTMGVYMLSASDALLQQNAPEWHWSEAHVIRRFLRRQPYRGTDQADQFYDLMSEVQDTVKSMTLMIEREGLGVIAEQEKDEYLAEKVDGVTREDIYGMAKAVQETAEQARELRNLMDLTYQSTDMTPKQKADTIDALRAELNKLFKDAVEAGMTLHQKREADTQSRLPPDAFYVASR